MRICVAIGQIEQWEENRYPSWIFESASSGTLRKNIPLTSDDPNAAQIEDARIRQLPTSFELFNGGKQRVTKVNTDGSENFSKEDFQILM